MGIVVDADLPPIEEEIGIVLRTGPEVAERIIVLTYLSCVVTDPSLQQEVMRFLIHEKLWDKVSPSEKIIFHKTRFTQDEVLTVLWRAESILILMWVIGKVDSLELPIEETLLTDILPMLPGFFESTENFRNTASIRSTSEILDHSDLNFRINWLIMRQRGGLQTLPFHPAIAYERYYSLNWVTHARVNWDDDNVDISGL